MNTPSYPRLASPNSLFLRHSGVILCLPKPISDDQSRRILIIMYLGWVGRSGILTVRLSGTLELRILAYGSTEWLTACQISRIFSRPSFRMAGLTPAAYAAARLASSSLLCSIPNWVSFCGSYSRWHLTHLIVPPAHLTISPTWGIYVWLHAWSHATCLPNIPHGVPRWSTHQVSSFRVIIISSMNIEAKCIHWKIVGIPKE